MKRSFLFVLVTSLLVILPFISANAFDVESLFPMVKSPYNPVPFQNFVASPSTPVRVLFSDTPAGRMMKEGLLKKKHMDFEPSDLLQLPESEGVVEGIVASPSVVNFQNILFNRESLVNALPQNEQSVDFIPGAGTGGADLVVMGSNEYRNFGLTGYYVSLTGQNPTFEGGLPPVPDPLQAGDTLQGGGAPVIAADPARGAVFAADLRFDSSTTAIGVFRTTVANLRNNVTCPQGATHTPAKAATCWPVKRVVGQLPDSLIAYFNDKPHMAIDQRATGTGAGNVYISWTEFDYSTFYSRIMLVQCNNSLSTCGAPVVVSISDTDTQFSHIAVKPNGIVTVSWINVRGPAPDGGQIFDIKYSECRANPLGCNVPRTIVSENRAIPFDGFLGAQDFRIATYPKHLHRQEGTAIRTFFFWDRCKVARIGGNVCVDADILLAHSTAPLTGAITIGNVDINAQDQFFPWASVDQSGVVNVAYYTSQADSVFQHRVQVKVAHIVTGAVVVNDFHTVATALNDPSSDPNLGGSLFGDYIGISARGTTAQKREAYVGFTYNDRQGSYFGVAAPQQDNKLSKITY